MQYHWETLTCEGNTLANNGEIVYHQDRKIFLFSLQIYDKSEELHASSMKNKSALAPSHEAEN